MELPREPTSLPQARRYSRTFDAPRNKTFGPQESVMINIPPIDRTYLTKNNKLHFDATLTYLEASEATWSAIANELGSLPTTTDALTSIPFINGFFQRTSQNQVPAVRTAANYYNKPMPFLDINGAYGFIHRIRVYDFLGTTLLEDVQEHDVLTAMLADFDFKDENLRIYRPYVADNKSTASRVRKQPCSFFAANQEDGLNLPISISNWVQVGAGNALTSVTITPSPVTLTQHFSIDLYSFLGKLSNKFVPLHNGFRLEFTFNKADVPISFSTAYGGLNVFYRRARVATDQIFGRTLDPSIQSLRFSNIYLKTDLLELSVDMDKEVDKMVHYQGFKYQQDFYPYPDFSGSDVAITSRPDLYKPIPQPFLSLNKVMIGQRPVQSAIEKQKLGFRIRNFINTADLLYNRSSIQSFQHEFEFVDAWREAFGTNPDMGLTIADFLTDEETYTGTNGFQFYMYSDSQRQDILNYMTSLSTNTSGDVIGSAWWPGFEGNTALAVGSDIQASFTIHSTDNQGRFLIVYDTRIPGTTSDTVGGIDTTKTRLEYKLTSTAGFCYKVYLDIFCQHDALLKIDPGKSTIVSF